MNRENNDDHEIAPAGVYAVSLYPERDLSSEEDYREIEGFLDETTSISYGFGEKLTSESRTWRLVPNPLELRLQNNEVAVSIANGTFTIVRATIPEGGYKCYMTLAWFATNGRWTTLYGTNPPTGINVHVKNAAGGLLMNWDIGGVHFPCGLRNSPMSWQTDFNPDIYDLITRVTVYFGRGSWYGVC